MKKVLLITYYWPPSGGGGVQRWLKFAKYLPEFGWEPIVLTPSNPSVLEQDPSLEKDINPGLKVYKIPIWEPYGLASKLTGAQTIPKQGIVNKDKSFTKSVLTWLRGNLLMPDARIFWKKPAVKEALKIIEEQKIDLIVTTGPPHSLHLIGLEIKKETNIGWLADFRDPWSEWDILDELKLTRVARHLHRKLEQKVIHAADLVITVSKSWADDFTKKYQIHVPVITNGYDQNDLKSKTGSKSDRFRISHFGMINAFRNISVFWEVLDELCAEDKGFHGDLELFFAGNIDENIKRHLDEMQFLKQKIYYAGYLQHGDLGNYYDQTSVFLLISNDSKNAGGHIPGKLFEYLQTAKSILAFSPKGGDVAGIIEASNTGFVVDSNDKDAVKSAVIALYNKYKKGEHFVKSDNISQFERKNLTKRLSSCFNELLESK